MKHPLLLIYFLIFYFNFAFSKDIIGSEGIPSHWKQYHANSHKPHYIPNKSLGSKLNYETNLQDVNKFISSQYLVPPLHQITPPTLNNLVHKNLYGDLNKSASSDSNRDLDRQNDESDRNAENEKEKIGKDNTRSIEQKEEESSKHAKPENSFKSSDRPGSNGENSMHILHNHRKIPIRQTRHLNDANDRKEEMYEEDKSVDTISEIEELQDKKLMKKRSDEEKSEILQQSSYIIEDSRIDNEVSVKETIFDNTNKPGNNVNTQPIYMNPIYDPMGWIRYAFMSNQFNLPNRNYIGKLYPYTKDNNPFYMQD